MTRFTSMGLAPSWSPSAVPKDHPELLRARELGIPVIRRAEALGEAVAGGTLVAVAGTHGKTTTTVMTTEALASAGRSPTGLAGGRVAAWHGNLRAGDNTLFVVEADEYDRSFLALSPTIATITNVEADHLDIYADLADIRRAFEQFLAPARTVVTCADDAGAHSLSVPAQAEHLTYGIANESARISANEILSVEGRLHFRVGWTARISASSRCRFPACITCGTHWPPSGAASRSG
jgi:UDP-N-acetylmuramate--alanine ligase